MAEKSRSLKTGLSTSIKTLQELLPSPWDSDEFWVVFFASPFLMVYNPCYVISLVKYMIEKLNSNCGKTRVTLGDSTSLSAL